MRTCAQCGQEITTSCPFTAYDSDNGVNVYFCMASDWIRWYRAKQFAKREGSDVTQPVFVAS